MHAIDTIQGSVWIGPSGSVAASCENGNEHKEAENILNG
jgi:hypothetical protein